MTRLSTLLIAAALTLGTSAAFAENITAGAATNGGGASPGASAATSGNVNSASVNAGANTNASVSTKKMNPAATTGAGKVNDGVEKR